MIKLLVFLTSVLALSNHVNAQKLIDNSKYLFVGYSTTQGPPNDRWAKIDVLSITKTEGLDTFFNVGGVEYFKSAKKSYLIDSKDTLLIFDEGLNQGDTFFTNNQAISIVARVDSIRFVKLTNGKSYKHWYLNDLQSPGTLYVWVEGLGERQMGWRFLLDIKKLHLPSVAAICQNQELTRWDSSLSNYGKVTISKTCDFESISQVLSVKQLVVKPQLLYPNPVQSFLTIDSVTSIDYIIFDINGNEILKGKYVEPIDVSKLKHGFYIVRLTSGKQITNTKIFKDISGG